MLHELATKIKEVHDTAPERELVTMILLFGIKYSSEIKKVGIKNVIAQSGIKDAYYIEVTKG